MIFNAFLLYKTKTLAPAQKQYQQSYVAIQQK